MVRTRPWRELRDKTLADDVTGERRARIDALKAEMETIIAAEEARNDQEEGAENDG